MNKKDNKDEIRAKKYLQSLEYEQVVYEPLGNVTPDFLLDEKIAVEVRRINRNHIDGDRLLSIENFEIPLVKNIKKIISTFSYKAYERSAYTSITIDTPLDIKSKTAIIKKLKKTLKYHTRHIDEIRTYKLSDSIELTFTPSEEKNKQYIFTGCNNDPFWVVNELHKNIQSVIDEKNKKIDKNFKLYNEWWLILVDSIIYGLDDEDFKELKNIHLNKQKFSKVIILPPKGDFKAFEL